MFSRLELSKHNGASGGRQLFKLTRAFRFSMRVNGGDISVFVPEGFVTDFASVPRIFWPIFPPAGRYCEAAVIHDYLCASGTCSRFLADSLFRECMCQLGVPLWKRWLMYYGVRTYAVCRSIYRFLTPWREA